MPTNEIESLNLETQILKECQSPHIVQYYGSFYNSNYLWLVMEYCAAGSVIDLIKIANVTLTEPQIASIIFSTLKGLDYLHENRKIHRDIKAGNILLDLRGNAKLADFGVSAHLNTMGDKDTVIGTPYWMSPEIISKGKYNSKTDIWSLGITTIEIAERDPPFSHIHPIRAMFAIQKNPAKGLLQPEKWSQEFNNFIGLCLTVDPNKRPTAKELLKHSFLLKATKGIIGELVLENIQFIEKYRIQQASKFRQIVHENIQSQKNERIEHDDYFANETGTMIQYKTIV